MTETLEEIKDNLLERIRSGRRIRLPAGWEFEYMRKVQLYWLTGPNGERHPLSAGMVWEAEKRGKIAYEESKVRFLPAIEALANRALRNLESNRTFTWEGWDVSDSVFFPKDGVELRVPLSALPSEIREFLEEGPYRDNIGEKVSTLFIERTFTYVEITLHRKRLVHLSSLSDEELLVKSMEYIRGVLQREPTLPGYITIGYPGMRDLDLCGDRYSAEDLRFSVGRGRVPPELLEKLHLTEFGEWRPLSTPTPVTPVPTLAPVTPAPATPTTETPNPVTAETSDTPATETQRTSRSAMRKGRWRNRGSRRRS